MDSTTHKENPLKSGVGESAPPQSLLPTRISAILASTQKAAKMLMLLSMPLTAFAETTEPKDVPSHGGVGEFAEAVLSAEALTEQFAQTANAALLRASGHYYAEMQEIIREIEYRVGLVPASNPQEDPLYQALLKPMIKGAADGGVVFSDNEHFKSPQEAVAFYRQGLVELYFDFYKLKLDQLEAFLPTYFSFRGSLQEAERRNILGEQFEMARVLEDRMRDVRRQAFPEFDPKKQLENTPSTKYQYAVQEGMRRLEKLRPEESWTAKFNFLTKKFSEYRQLYKTTPNPDEKKDLELALTAIMDYRHNLGNVPSVSPVSDLLEARPSPEESTNEGEVVAMRPTLILEAERPQRPSPSPVEMPESMKIGYGETSKYIQWFEQKFWSILLEQFTLEWQTHAQMQKKAYQKRMSWPLFNIEKAYKRAVAVAEREMSKIDFPPNAIETIVVDLRDLRFDRTPDKLETRLLEAVFGTYTPIDLEKPYVWDQMKPKWQDQWSMGGALNHNNATVSFQFSDAAPGEYMAGLNLLRVGPSYITVSTALSRVVSAGAMIMTEAWGTPEDPRWEFLNDLADARTAERLNPYLQ